MRRLVLRLAVRILIGVAGLVGFAMAATPQSAWVGHLPDFVQRPAEPPPKSETAEVRQVRRARSVVAPRPVRKAPPLRRVPRVVPQPSAPPTPPTWIFGDPPIARGPPPAAL
jgi:hypothetical protein